MNNLSYQLYSSREFPPWADVLQRLAKAGYREVEGFAGNYADVGATAAALETAGLRMRSGHFAIENLEEDVAGCIATARALGMETIYSPYLVPEFRPTDIVGWEAIGMRLRDIGKAVNDAGLNFGWHNHDFEVQQLPDGSLPLDHIFASAANLQWEADLAWVVRGGCDVNECIKKHQARITSVHIKDIAKPDECKDEDGWADVGHGTMDWPGLLDSLVASPIRHFVVEHDKPSDDWRFASRTAEYLLRLPVFGG